MHPTDLLRAPARVTEAALGLAAGAGGAALAATVQALAAARNVPKPLHPRGRYSHGRLTRFGSSDQSGAAWLDGKGSSPVVVRHSGAIGFPLGWPDIQGIAVRVHEDDNEGDLLFATTGLGAVSRYVLTGASTIDGRPYTTLLPYRGSNGAVVLALRPDTPTSMTLLWAHGSGRWHTFGMLELTETYDGPAISFDPMLATLPGLVPYAWVRALRAPSYRVARAHRGQSLPGPHPAPEQHRLLPSAMGT